MNAQRRLGSNVVFIFGSEAMTRLVSAVLLIVVSRALGPAGAGIYSIGTTLLFLGSRFSMWGLDQILIRDVATDAGGAGKYLSNFLFLRVVLSCLAAGGLTILIWTVLPYAPESRLPLTVIVWGLVAENVMDICRAVFIALGRMKYVLVISGITAVGRVAGVVLTLLGQWGVLGFAGAVAVGGCIGALCGLALLRLRFALAWQRPSLHFCRTHMVDGVPFWVINLVNVMDLQVDSLVLSILATEAQLGIYSAGLGVLLALIILPTTFRMAFFPTVVQLFRNDRPRLLIFYQQSLKYLTMLAIPLCVLVSISADQIVVLIYGRSFQEAGQILRVLSWCLLFLLPGDINGRLLLASGNQRRSALFTSFGLIINIALNLVLVPKIGIMGSAWARLASNIITVACHHMFVNDHLVPSNLLKLLWQPALAALLMVIPIVMMPDASLPLKLLVVSSVYVAVLIILRAISVSDVASWLGFNPQ